MINIKANLFLLAMPIILMGIVESFFGLLSVAVFHDQIGSGFLRPGIYMIVIATLMMGFAKQFDSSRIGYRDALLFATLTWIICGLLGAVPIVLVAHTSITDGVFESISALTTTGATVLSGLDQMPRSFLMYRQFLQWLGGLGVVIFVVAILPMLNVGGMKLLKAETPGPIKDDKLSPRITKTAHYLWLIYLILTVLCCIAYVGTGMSFFDAIAHSFTTVSTGGFSTHDASMGYFDKPSILLVSDVFMLMGAISFALHFQVLWNKDIKSYWRNEETRVFLYMVAFMAIVIILSLGWTGEFTGTLAGFNNAFFLLVSFITSTGYGTAELSHWPMLTILLLVFAGYLGGCAGSTAGGNKIIRGIISFKLVLLQLKQLVHPQGVFAIRYQKRAISQDVLNATKAFMSMAAFSSMVLTIMLMSTGLDFWSSFTAVTACLNVLGPAFGVLGNNFQPVSDQGTWLLSAAMLLGRLEYFTVLALLTPMFWRR